MSISNLLVPNNFNIFVGSITPPVGSVIINGKLTITNDTANGTANINIDQKDLTTSANDIQFSSNGTPIFYVGENPLSSDSYLWAQNDFKIGTDFTERLRIPQTGIALDNTATSILALQGATTTLVSKNNVIDTSSVQTLTNKTINSNNNTIIAGAVSGTPNLNTVLNQNVSTTAIPQFEGMIFNNAGIQSLRTYPVHGTVGPSGGAIMLTFVLPVNTSVVISTVFSAHCLNGSDQGYSDFIYDFKLVNTGTIVGSDGNNALSSEVNLIGGYVGNLVIFTTVTDAINVNVELSSTLADGTITYGGYIDLCFA